MPLTSMRRTMKCKENTDNDNYTAPGPPVSSDYDSLDVSEPGCLMDVYVDTFISLCKGKGHMKCKEKTDTDNYTAPGPPVSSDYDSLDVTEHGIKL
ncbi:hypothetical protein MAR_022894 [Mya arenaria]|uniref:Uncharacterized protein n=1 Tax=Mya arenaria TaxID=6604 RepID=A0ABY7DLD3_MYAAR|nr:hypothetical protein MAR_022894 [Mya arenaria]